MTDDPPIRIFLSPPDVGWVERDALLEAFDSNWIAPVGPHLDAFERDVADRVGVAHAVALSSGTAALHLALLQAGVGSGDRVLCSTLTFVASANPIRYLGAEPVFVDAAAGSWNLDPALVAAELEAAAARGEPYAAVVAVDLYGSVADHPSLEAICAEHGVPLIEDAAEALGSTLDGQPAGSFGDIGVFSFNGNKIITTSGGGMLVTGDPQVADRVRSLAAQAREPAPHYEHEEVGFNYRMSNLLAALGSAQIAGLDDRITSRRRLAARYRELLGDLPGLHLPSERSGESTNAWLTCVTIDPSVACADREAVRLALRARGIEARPVWKPMHLQPLFAEAKVLGGENAAERFTNGLCLPSGSSLTDAEQDEVCAVVRSVVGGEEAT